MLENIKKQTWHGLRHRKWSDKLNTEKQKFHCIHEKKRTSNVTQSEMKRDKWRQTVMKATEYLDHNTETIASQKLGKIKEMDNLMSR